MSTDNRKHDQRARLVRAIVEIAADEGYAQASIAQAVARAGVSRSTFYEQFKDKRACFAAAQEELGGELLARVQDAARGAGTERAGADAVLGALVAFAEQDTPGAQVLMNEALAAGGRAMDRRDRLIAEMTGVLERAWENAAAAPGPRLDVPAQALVGGAFRLISIRILRGVGSMYGLLPDLLAWAGSYANAGEAPRHRQLTPRNGMRLPRSPYAELPTSPPPESLPPGRHGLSAAYVSRNQRERIVHAGAQTIVRKGYADATITDIVAAAHLTRAAFYGQFKDKQELFLEIQQAHFQQTMAVGARAFFSAPTWPERVWEGIRAIADLFAQSPELAHFGALESHVAGTESVRTYTTDAMMAYTVFLEEGYRRRPESRELPTLCSEAIAGTLFETIYRAARERRVASLPQLTPTIVYIALAPFLGPEQAGELVREKLHELT